MGTYTTVTALATYLPGVSNLDTTTTAEYSLAVLSIEDAEAEVNKYVGQRFDVSAWNTSTAVPPLIRTLTRRLATGLFMDAMYTGDGHNANEWTARWVEMPRENLDLIRRGMVDVQDTGGSSVSEINTSNRIRSSTFDYTPIYNLDSSTAWVLDPDQKEDITNDRS